MAIHNVSTSSGLGDALTNAVSGDTIVLAAGAYGDFSHTGTKDYSPGRVTVTSNGAAVTFDALRISNKTALDFDNLDMTCTASSPAEHVPFLFFSGPNNDCAIKNSRLTGSYSAGGYGLGRGVDVRNCTNIEVSDNVILGFTRGITALLPTYGLSILRNEIYDVTDDHMQFCNVQDLLIEGNFLHDSNMEPGSLAHRDMVQFHTSGATIPFKNVIVRGNTLDMADGDWTQSLFLGNESGASLPHQNLLIEDNVIYNRHLHGITVGVCSGLTIRRNTLIEIPYDTTRTNNATKPGFPTKPRINLSAGSTSVSVTDNIASDTTRLGVDPVSTGGEFTLSNNHVLALSDYASEYDNAKVTYSPGLNDWTAKVGSTADTNTAGAPSMLPGGSEPPALPVMPADGQVTLAFTVG